VHLERSYRSFEASERMMVGLKTFNTLFHWMTTYDYFHISSFHDFLILFFFFSFSFGVSPYTSCVVHHLVFKEFQLYIYIYILCWLSDLVNRCSF
jgi:hypothetical protein